MSYKHDDSALTLMDWFCGAGGSSQGAHAVPGVRVELAANHWAKAIESHAANFPNVDHYQGDIREADITRWPAADLFWASPECPKWSVARGKKRDYVTSLQGSLFGDEPDEETERSRALMEEVPLYLAAAQRRGHTVRAGVVENVVDVRGWDQWDRWIGEIRTLGYSTRLIAMNSMHADPRVTLRAPQSRDRLYLAYWHRSIGRTPDWDKWLRPRAWCPTCDQWVRAVQSFKKPGTDMGRYKQQYVYRCPRVACRNSVIEPETLPAAVAIDWTLPGERIGDKPLKEFFSDKAKTKSLGFHPLAPKTLARVEAGLERFARPLLVPAGGTWRENATPATAPMAARTTRENDALAIPPILVPVEGRDGKEPRPANEPLRTQTARNETGLAWLPFVAELRGGGSDARSVVDALATVTASGNHHGLVAPPGVGAMVMRNNGSAGAGGEHCTAVAEPLRTLTAAGHQSLVTWQDVLVPYYGTGTARQVVEPIGTLSTRDRYALVHGQVDVEDCMFRMLEPHEIGRAMSFGGDYIVVGNKRQKVRQYGNAVTPNVAEVIISALVEAITGEPLDREAAA